VLATTASTTAFLSSDLAFAAASSSALAFKSAFNSAKVSNSVVS
jgi:hypothetical protein